MIDFETIDYYTDPSLISDPSPYFEYLRAKCPVTRLPHRDVFAVTGYHEVIEAFRDSEHFSSCNATGGPLPGFSVDPKTAEDVNEFIAAHRHELPLSDYVGTQDPPMHKAQRDLVNRLFSPSRVRENEAFTRELADQRVSEIINQGKIEVRGDYARPIAGLVITDLLGVPEEDRMAFLPNLAIGPPTVKVGGDGRPPELDPMAFLQGTFTNYIEDRRRNPRHDVLTELATATYSDGTLPETEAVVRVATFMFQAGHNTTATLITNALRIIAEMPDVQSYLRADFDRIPNFIEETLRYESVLKNDSRLTRTDIALGGVEIPAGTTVALFPGAANHDPRFWEAPDEFRPDRPNAKLHASFGRGIHFCPGASLARMEGQVSIERFLAHTSDIRIDESFHGPKGSRRYDYEPDYMMRTPKALHLEIDPAEPRRSPEARGTETIR
jgi:cytochrome P450